MNDLSDILEQYLTENRFHHFEGDSGMDRMTKVCEDLGYPGHGFKYGTPIESFLSDNPGAMQAILDWVGEQNIPEWRENLESHLSEDDEDETSDDE